MNVKIQSIKFDADQKLIDFINNKLEKFASVLRWHYWRRGFLKVEMLRTPEIKRLK